MNFDKSTIKDRAGCDEDSGMNSTPFPINSQGRKKEDDDFINGDTEAARPLPKLVSSLKKLDPQLVEKFYADLNSITESTVQETALRMHTMVDNIVEVFETQRQAALESSLAVSQDLIKDIQQMEDEQEVMNYQIDLYTRMVHQAHEQVFKAKVEK